MIAQHKHIQLEKFSANEFLLNKMKVGDILALYFQENRPVNVRLQKKRTQLRGQNLQLFLNQDFTLKGPASVKKKKLEEKVSSKEFALHVECEVNLTKIKTKLEILKKSHTILKNSITESQQFSLQ